MDKTKIHIEIASDVLNRDGIGIEIIQDNKTILEIFRDDSEKTRVINFFDKSIPLELVEYSIEKFKKNIPWDFIDNSNISDNE